VSTVSVWLERFGYVLGAALMLAVFVFDLRDGVLAVSAVLLIWKPLAASRRGFVEGWRG